MEELLDHRCLIQQMILDGRTHQDISQHLTSLGIKHASARTISRFCSEHRITRRCGVDQGALNNIVAECVKHVGPTYGRKMMTGHLSSRGINVSEARVGRALATVNPLYHHLRQQGSRNFNPVPYQADHFGHKIHLDQNEKLVMFGVTHVIAVDGYSGKIVGYTSMPVKNNITIYEDVYRSAVLKYGMWDQMRVDHGKEFFLCLYMQEKNEQYRNRREYQPYCQTTSIKNHRVERLWVEINNRLNFPIKRAIVQSVNENRIDLDDDIVKYCVSSLLLNLCRIGLKTVVESWNAHPIPGKGKPNELALLKAHTGDIPPELLPSGGDAADSYMNDIGSNLKLPRDFAPNPFQTEDDMLECENTLTMRYPNLQLLISACLNNNDKPLQDAVVYIIQITKNILSR